VGGRGRVDRRHARTRQYFQGSHLGCELDKRPIQNMVRGTEDFQGLIHPALLRPATAVVLHTLSKRACREIESIRCGVYSVSAASGPRASSSTVAGSVLLSRLVALSLWYFASPQSFVIAAAAATATRRTYAGARFTSTCRTYSRACRTEKGVDADSGLSHPAVACGPNNIPSISIPPNNPCHHSITTDAWGIRGDKKAQHAWVARA
jgi:hypothetical protein